MTSTSPEHRVVVGLEVQVVACTGRLGCAEQQLRRLGTIASESLEPLETAVQCLDTQAADRRPAGAR